MGELTKEMEKLSGFDHTTNDIFKACGAKEDEVKRVCCEASKEDAISKTLLVVQESSLTQNGKLLACFYLGGFHRINKICGLFKREMEKA